MVREVTFDLGDYAEYEDAVEALDLEFSGSAPTTDDTRQDTCISSIALSPIRESGQRGTAVGRFCGKGDFNPGRFDAKIKPPGYVKFQDHSSHLIASNFYGPGTAENLVAMYEKANLSGMRTIENRTTNLLRKDEEVVYVVTPVYEGGSERPWAVHMQGRSSGGASWDACVLNKDQKGYVDGSVCRGPRPADVY
ncbi:hypothetical protein HNR23_000491 [Nocardiopsis mwathae]|uniref:Type VII secretion system protein EssD-like domain-containing protein n=1 Tax=Nocardiopsis mwathae TaxID=1472723 RepID=A0A7W9YFC2_9ACTN|nr:hypothetical protein [Nocardiopsis mwathae]